MAVFADFTVAGLPPRSGADDAFFADGDKSVVVNLEHQQVIEVIDRATKTVTWEYGTLGKRGAAPGFLDYPDDAYMLPNGIEPDARTWHAEQPVRVVELDADLQVLLDYVVDRDGRLDWDTARMGIFGEKRLRVLFDRLVGHIGNDLGH